MIRLLLFFLIISLISCKKTQVAQFKQCDYNDINFYQPVHHFYYRLGSFNKVDCLLAPDIIDKKEFRVIHSFKIPDPRPGEIMHSYFQLEFTNPMSKPMMLSWYQVLTDSPSSVDGLNITRPVGTNITSGQHHAVIESIGFAELPVDDNIYLNFVGYAASGERELSNEFIIVEPGYSTIYIKRE